MITIALTYIYCIIIILEVSDIVHNTFCFSIRTWMMEKILHLLVLLTCKQFFVNWSIGNSNIKYFCGVIDFIMISSINDKCQRFSIIRNRWNSGDKFSSRQTRHLYGKHTEGNNADIIEYIIT